MSEAGGHFIINKILYSFALAYAVMLVIVPVDDIFWSEPYEIPEKKQLLHSIQLTQETLDQLKGIYQLKENRKSCHEKSGVCRCFLLYDDRRAGKV